MNRSISDFRGVFYFFHRDILSRKVVSDKPGTVHYECRSCNEIYEYEDIVTKAFEKRYFVSHRDISKGAEDISCECPECSGYFFYDEALCVCCGHEIDLACDVCGDVISSDEVIGYEGTCSYCMYRWEKISEE